MKIGTKSLLFGAHQFILHPLCVALAWRRLYGFWPRGLRTWIAIVIHDWGYWELPNMDGEEGAAHPAWAGDWCGFHFGRWPLLRSTEFADTERAVRYMLHWGWFVSAHSRSYAAYLQVEPSPLMNADKLATTLMPRPLYAFLCWLSGEWIEYRDRWVAAGTYPGKPNDGVWAWSGHLQANWARFRRLDAIAGTAFGNE